MGPVVFLEIYYSKIFRIDYKSKHSKKKQKKPKKPTGTSCKKLTGNVKENKASTFKSLIEMLILLIHDGGYCTFFLETASWRLKCHGVRISYTFSLSDPL